jgi:hypothetical protein
MAVKIDIKHSNVAGVVPTTSSINLNEIAFNTVDGKAYFKRDSGTASIKELIATPHSGSFILSGSQLIEGYIQFRPVVTNINQSISASYIYVSGSTNDLYFTQNGQGYANTTRLRWLEGNLYTGLLHGGFITTQSSTVYQVSSGSGVIVNLNASIPNDPYPIVQYLNWPNLSSSIASLSASYDQQFVAINSSAQIFAQGIPYNDGDYNTKIPIGIVIHQNHSTINAVQTFPSVGYGWKQRSYDFIKAFGPLKISGYTLQASSSLGLLLNGGVAWVDGRNYTIDPNNPSYINEAVGIGTSKIYYYYQSGSEFNYLTNNGAGYTQVTASLYSNNGVLTALSNNNKWSIQRVYYFPNSATKALYVYYGNAQYDTYTDALAGIQNEAFLEAPNTLANAIFVGYMLLQKTANFTTTPGPTGTWEFRSAGLFRGISGGSGGSGGGGGGGVTSLAGLTDVSISSPINGQPLTYNSTTTKWSNSSVITASLNGTASWANNAATASYVNNLNQSVTIGNITSTPAAENTLNVYPPFSGGTGEGGQILLAASGGLYTSASMLDTWQNQFRILRGTNTGGSNASMVTVNLNTGDITGAGKILPSNWSAGQIIQTILYSASDLGFTTNYTNSTNTYSSIVSSTYTPLSITSYIFFEVYAMYDVSGGGGDSFFSQITWNGAEIGVQRQVWANGAGGGTRSGTLFPLAGRVTNGSLIGYTWAVNARRDSSDDTLTVYPNVGFYVKITEIGR